MRCAKWSLWFGQFEGFGKLYPDCEVTPSSSQLVIAKVMMRYGSVGILRRRAGVVGSARPRDIQGPLGRSSPTGRFSATIERAATGPALPQRAARMR